MRVLPANLGSWSGGEALTHLCYVDRMGLATCWICKGASVKGFKGGCDTL